MKLNTSKLAKKYIEFVYPRSLILSLIALLVLAGAIWYTKDHLKLNNDLASLLPEQTPSVQALNESTRRFGSSDKFLLALQGDDPRELAALQESIQKVVLRDWNDILISAQIQRDNSFFVDHALLYLPLEHLERIRDNLVVIQRDLSGAINPFMVDLTADEDKQDPEELVWFESDIPQELGLPDEAAEAFEGFYGKMAIDSTGKHNKDVKEEKWDPKAGLPEDLKTRLIGKHRDGSWNAVVLCKLTGSSTDLNFTAKVINRADSLLNSYRAENPDVHFAIQGSYEGLKDVEDLQNDGLIATMISVGLILFLVIGFFRSFVAAALLLLQVGFAATLMLFFTAVFYGQLNPYTLFVAAIIIGMGIDFSIHMMGTIQRFSLSMPLKNAMIEAIDHLLQPMFLAALTTVAGLLTLLIADFRGFYEFGVIASVGVTLSFATAVFGLPVLIKAVGGLPKVKQIRLIPDKISEDQLSARLNMGVRILVLFLILSVLFMPWAEFEHNFRNLRPAPRKVEKNPNEPNVHTGVAMTSKRKSSQPAAVMGDTPEELNKLYDTLMVRLHQEKDTLLRSFLTLKTFVPPEEDQEERLEIVEEIDDLINAKVFDDVKGDDSAMVMKLREMVDVDIFSAEDIPEWALSILKERDGTYGTIGFIYGSYKSWDAREMRKFQDKYSHWNFGGKDLRVFSSAFIVSDVISAVKSDSARMGVFIFFVLILTLSLALRNVKLVLVSMIPISAAIVMTIGLMGMVNFAIELGKVSMYNVIVVPMSLGVGIDATIHLLHAAIRDRKKGLKHLYNTTGLMVMAASLTTISGFIGMLVINHRGLRTIGELAVISISSTMITAMLLTPWLARKLFSAKDSEDQL